jgi:group I intron endonuclease
MLNIGGYLYIITNEISGKQYVGIGRNPQGRWSSHKWKAEHGKSSRPLYQAMRRNGIENFSFIVLAKYPTLDKLKEAEQDLIWQLGTNCKEFGYNLSEGGEGTTGYSHTEEAKVAIGNAAKELWASEDHRTRMQEARTKYWEDPASKERQAEITKGLWESEDYRRKQSESQRRAWDNEERRRKSAEVSRAMWEQENFRQSFTAKGQQREFEKSGLTEDQVRAIRKTSGFPSHIGRKYGISRHTVSRIQKREIFNHIPD